MTTPPVHALVIAGTDFSQYTTQDFNIQQEWGRQGDTATIYMHDEHSTPGALNFVPKALDTVTLNDVTNGVTLFGGVIGTPSMEWLGPTSMKWSLSCRDFTYYMDTIVVSGSFVGQRADVIIKSLIAQANCGIAATFIAPGPVIPKVQIKFISLSQALTKITMLASGALFTATGPLTKALSIKGSRVTEFAWYVDENRDLHWFNSITAVHSGITITDQPPATGPTAKIGTFDRESFKYTWDGTNIRTSAIVRGGNYSGGHTDNFFGTGAQRSWPLTFDLDTSANQQTLVLTVHAKAKTVQAFTANDLGQLAVTTQYAVIQSANGQWFLVVGPNEPTPGLFQSIILTYAYGGTIVARADDFQQQRALYGPNRGIFQVALKDASLVSFATAHHRGQRELTEYSAILEQVEFTTTEDFTGHIQAGDRFKFHSSFTPDSQRNYAIGVDAHFLAERVRITCKPATYRVYDITATRIS